MKVSEWKDKTEWNRFIAKHSQPASFLQSWEWGQLQKGQGNEVLRLGFQPTGTHDRNQTDLIATASIIRRCLPLPKMCFLYLPRGPIIRQDNLGSQGAIIERLLETIGKNGHIFLRVIPNWSRKLDRVHWQELDFGDPQVLTKQREPELTLLTKLQEAETMLEQMHQKTRYNVRLAERKNVGFSFYQKEKDLETFWNLLNTTAGREKIRIYKKDYYTVLMMATRLLTNLEERVTRDQVRSVLGFASYNGKPLACGLWLGFGNTLTYLHGGSSREHKEVMAPYKLHWEMMQWGQRQGYEYYDWWGIEKKESVFHLGGVSRFKKGFGGEEYEFAGTYDYIYQKKTFKYLGMLKKMKQIF